MKIVVNAVSAKSGGAATYVENLARGLSAFDHGLQVHFYVPSARLASLQGLDGNVRVTGTDVGARGSWKRLLWDQITLRRIVRRSGADILLSSSDFGMWLPACRQVLMVRNPLFFSRLYLETFLPVKSLRFRLEFALRRWLISLSVRFSDVVITASGSMMRDLNEFISVPEARRRVNSFGAPLERFTPIDATSSAADATEAADASTLGTAVGGPFRILHVSEYSDYKNLTTLLKAALLLRERGVDGFRIVTTADPGQFPDVEISTREEDRALAGHPLVAPSLEFTGRIPYDDVPRLYARSDLFVFPSLAESFGHPLVEAMASGLPILASDIPLCREICGDAAEYFSPLDANELAEKIILLRSDPERRARLGQGGRVRAQTRFDWNEHVRRMVETLEEVVRAEPPRENGKRSRRLGA